MMFPIDNLGVAMFKLLMVIGKGNKEEFLTNLVSVCDSACVSI